MISFLNHGFRVGAVCLALALSSAACDDGGTEMGDETTGDGDGDGDASGDGDGDATGDGDGDGVELSHAADIQPIWDAACVGCHSPGGTAEFLDLSEDAYDNIVGVTSTQVQALQLVEAGSADTSYLVNKVMGTQADAGGAGGTMPPVGDPISAEDMTTLTEWINAGALP